MSLAPRIDKIGKNYLINGAMDYWQRSVGPQNTNTSLLYQAVDRWRVQSVGTFTGTPNIRQSTTIPSSSHPYSLRHDFRRNASTATLAYEQRIEADYSAEMIDEGLGSVSLMINPPAAGTVQVTIKNATVKDDHTAQNNMAQSTLMAVTASSWQEIKFEDFAINSNAALGLAVHIQYVSASGTDGSDVSLFLTRISLSATSKAIRFTRAARNFAEELKLCQKFLRLIDSATFTANTTTTVEGYNAWEEMRVTPTASAHGGTITIEDPNVSAFTQSSAHATLIVPRSNKGGKLQLQNFTGLTDGAIHYMTPSNGRNIQLEAEL